jgi:hypothetical protein
VTGHAEHFNEHSHYVKSWNSKCTIAAVDFTWKADPWTLLFVMILMIVMEIAYKTGAEE